MFDDILERKKAFLDSKITKLKKSKFWYFFQSGWGWAIGQKLEIFPTFLIFCKISQQNVFDVILESQKAFLDYKKQKVKKVEKSGFFSKGVCPWFWY